MNDFLIICMPLFFSRWNELCPASHLVSLKKKQTFFELSTWNRGHLGSQSLTTMLYSLKSTIQVLLSVFVFLFLSLFRRQEFLPFVVKTHIGIWWIDVLKKCNNFWHIYWKSKCKVNLHNFWTHQAPLRHTHVYSQQAGAVFVLWIFFVALMHWLFLLIIFFFTTFCPCSYISLWCCCCFLSSTVLHIFLLSSLLLYVVG